MSEIERFDVPVFGSGAGGRKSFNPADAVSLLARKRRPWAPATSFLRHWESTVCSI
jgi:hypothetical protein